MPVAFNVIKILIWLLGAATVVTAYFHGFSCFKDAGGVWFAIIAGLTLFVTYRAFVSSQSQNVSHCFLAVCLVVVVFGVMASFQPRYSYPIQFNDPWSPDETSAEKAKRIARQIIEADRRFEKLNVENFGPTQDTVYIKGSIATERDLFTLRDQLVFEGVSKVYWTVFVGDLDQAIAGFGDQALINRTVDESGTFDPIF